MFAELEYMRLHTRDDMLGKTYNSNLAVFGFVLGLGILYLYETYLILKIAN